LARAQHLSLDGPGQRSAPLDVAAQVEFESRTRKRFAISWFQALRSRRFHRGFHRINLHRCNQPAPPYSGSEGAHPGPDLLAENILDRVPTCKASWYQQKVCSKITGGCQRLARLKLGRCEDDQGCLRLNPVAGLVSRIGTESRSTNQNCPFCISHRPT